MSISFNRKKYEGSNYRDGTRGIDLVDNAVSPGSLFKYIWQVPERAGPTENDGDCLAWAYYSDTSSVEDFYTGLVGPLVVCKKVCIEEKDIVTKKGEESKKKRREVISDKSFLLAGSRVGSVSTALSVRPENKEAVLHSSDK